MRDILIIGGGAAGMTAGLYAARAGLDALIIERAFSGGQASTTNEIENYPGFPGSIGGPELMMKFEEQTRGAGCDFAWEDVESVSLAGDIKRVNSYEARTVIIATGAQRRKLGVPGEDANAGRGVSYCATCDGAFYKGKRVAVIGGGNTAVEDALYLSKFAETYLIHRRNELRARGSAVQRASQAATFMLDHRVSEIRREDGMLALAFDNGETLNVNGVFIAVGTDPVTAPFAGQVDMDAAGYILAGEDTRTSVPGVFVAGDCRAKPLRQIVTAAADGAVAAHMAGEYIG